MAVKMYSSSRPIRADRLNGIAAAVITASTAPGISKIRFRFKFVADYIGRTVHHPNVKPPEVFPHDAQREKLRARKHRNNRRQERKTLHGRAENQVKRQDISQRRHAKTREDEPNDAGEPERQGAESR